MSKSDDTLDPEKLATAASDDDGADRSSSSPPSSRDSDGGDDDDDDDDDSEPAVRAAKPASEPPKSSRPGGGAAPVMAHAVAGHAHAAEAHAHDEDHGLSHITPLSLLVGVLSALIVLTVVTVITAGVDLGAQWNLVVAMVIATVKASLVVTYFMHLRWDKKLHLLVFLSSVLFLILFLSMALADRKEYQHSIDEVDRAAQEKTP
jgi:cytochrome c oxidase subunit IV